MLVPSVFAGEAAAVREAAQAVAVVVKDVERLAVKHSGDDRVVYALEQTLVDLGVAEVRLRRVALLVYDQSSRESAG